MRSIFVLLILVMIGLNGKGQSVTALPDSVLSQCCLEVTLLNGNVTTVDWVFIQYITRDGTGTKLFVEYAPNFGGIQWETQIRIQDDFDDVLERSKFIVIPFTVGSTDYGINRNWIANIEENTTTGGTWIYGRFGTPTKRKFSAVEDYETMKNLLLACRPRAILIAENGLYTEGDTVRMGGFLIEPTRIQLEGYPITFIDTMANQSFGIGEGNVSGYFGDTIGYFSRRVGKFRQMITQGNRYNQIIIRDTTNSLGDYAEFYQGLYTGNKPYMFLDATNSEFDGKFSRVSIDFDSVYLENRPYLSSVDAYTRYSVAKSGKSSIGVREGELLITGSGVELGAYGYGIGSGASEYLFMKTKAVDNGTASVGQYLKLLNTSTGEVDFATIDLSAYLPIADTAAMLLKYPSTVGFGILKSGKTIQADTSKLATLFDISGFPSGTGTTDRSARWSATNTLAAGNMTDNGTKLQALLPFQLAQWTTAGRPSGVTYYVGQNTSTGYLEKYSGSAWGSIPTLLDANTWTAKQIIQSSTTYPFQIISNSEANNKISFNPASSRGGMFFSRLSDGNLEAGFGFYRMPGFTNGTAVINSRDAVLLAANTRSFFQVNNQGVVVQIAATNDAILTSNPLGVLFSVRSTTQGSIFAPKMTLSQRTAIPYVTGEHIGMGTYQTNAAEGIYVVSSVGWKRLLWEGDDTNIYNLDGSLTSNRTLTGGSFWLNLNSDVGIKQATPLQDFDVNGDLRVRDSTGLDVTPSHAAITGLLTRDATGWIGRASLTGSLSYSGGTLTSTWLKLSLEAGSVNINQGRVNKLRFNQDSGYFHLKNGVIFLQHPSEKNLITSGFPAVIVTSDTAGRWDFANAVVAIGSRLEAGNSTGYGYTMVGSLTRGIVNNFSGFFSTAVGYDIQIDSTVRTNAVGHKIITNKTIDVDAYGGRITISKGVNSAGVYGSIIVLAHDKNYIFGRGLSSRHNNEFLYGSNSNPKHTFIGTKLMVGADSTFSFNTTTDVLQLSQYGKGTKEAADLSKAESFYNAIWATDGTVIELERKRDTTIYVVNTDYDFSAALTTAKVAARYNRVIFLMTTTAAAGSDSELTLHAPDINLMQCEYLVRSTDEAGGFANVIRFGTNNAVDSTNGLASSYFPAAGQGVGIRAGLRSGVYKYFYY